MILYCWFLDYVLSGKDLGFFGYSKNFVFIMSEMGSFGGFRVEGMWDLICFKGGILVVLWKIG